MNYIMLLKDERIIFRVHPHWFYLLLTEIVLAFFGILLVYLVGDYFPYWFRGFAIFAVAFAMLIIFLQWFFTRYYLTNLRLIEERGIIGKRIVSIWLKNVEDITLKFGILGRIFNFGDLEIQSAGTYGKIVFNLLPKPRKLHEEIEKAILRLKKHV